MTLIIRSLRQRRAYEWALAAFGKAQVQNERQRALRFLEEAIELYQACGGSEEQAQKLLSFVFNRPIGTIVQEVGGVGLTLLVLCEALGIDADHEEFRELSRVLQKPLAEFTARNQEKIKAGFLDPTVGE